MGSICPSRIASPVQAVSRSSVPLLHPAAAGDRCWQCRRRQGLLCRGRDWS
jgi:hypothetical protein